MDLNQYLNVLLVSKSIKATKETVIFKNVFEGRAWGRVGGNPRDYEIVPYNETK